MHTVKMAGIIITVLVCYICHAAEKKTAKPYDTTSVRGVAGLLLLRTTPLLADEELRITRYRELLEITGTSARQLIVFLEELRKDPEAGLELYEAMQNEVSFKPEKPDTTQ